MSSRETNTHAKRKGKKKELETKKLCVDDFITMCSVCNEGAKNKDIKPITLLDRVRDSNTETQKDIYEFLDKKLNP